MAVEERALGIDEDSSAMQSYKRHAIAGTVHIRSATMDVDQSDRLSSHSLRELLNFLELDQPLRDLAKSIPRSFPDTVLLEAVVRGRRARFDVAKLEHWHVAFAIIAKRYSFLEPISAILGTGTRKIRCDELTVTMCEGLAARREGWKYPPYLWESTVVPCQDCRETGRRCLIPPARFVLEDYSVQFGIEDRPLQCMGCEASDGHGVCRIDRNLPMTLRTMGEWAKLLDRRRKAEEAELTRRQLEAQRRQELYWGARARHRERQLVAERDRERRRLDKEARKERQRLEREARDRIRACRREREKAADERRRLNLEERKTQTRKAMERDVRWVVEREAEEGITDESRYAQDVALPDVDVTLRDEPTRSTLSSDAGLTAVDEAIIQSCASLPTTPPSVDLVIDKDDDSDYYELWSPPGKRGRYQVSPSPSPRLQRAKPIVDAFRALSVDCADSRRIPGPSASLPATPSLAESSNPPQNSATSAAGEIAGRQTSTRKRKLVPYVEIETRSRPRP